MRLDVISDFGARTQTVSESTTPGILDNSFASIDWSGFRQVVLTAAKGDWLEVGGSTGDGFSMTLCEGGKQRLAAPASGEPRELLAMLQAFLAGDGGHTQLAAWS